MDNALELLEQSLTLFRSKSVFENTQAAPLAVLSQLYFSKENLVAAQDRASHAINLLEANPKMTFSGGVKRENVLAIAGLVKAGVLADRGDVVAGIRLYKQNTRHEIQDIYHPYSGEDLFDYFVGASTLTVTGMPGNDLDIFDLVFLEEVIIRSPKIFLDYENGVLVDWANRLIAKYKYRALRLAVLLGLFVTLLLLTFLARALPRMPFLWH